MISLWPDEILALGCEREIIRSQSHWQLNHDRMDYAMLKDDSQSATLCTKMLLFFLFFYLD